ncbi:MAG: integrin alpha, partial [Planctomycetota bacterium]
MHASFVPEGQDPYFMAGYAVTDVGDFNGAETFPGHDLRRYEDFAIGSPYEIVAARAPGTVALYLGHPDFPGAGGGQEVWEIGGVLPANAGEYRFIGESDGDLFGWAVEGNFDFDEDGYYDLAIGAPGYDNGRGRVYIILGRDLSAVPPGQYDMADLLAGSTGFQLVYLTGRRAGDHFG